MPRKHCEGNYSNGWWLSMLHSLAKAKRPPPPPPHEQLQQDWSSKMGISM